MPAGVRRRLLAACLAAALAGWLVPVTPAGAFPLEVVPADNWAYKTLYRLAAWGLAPLWAASARPLTRMELAEMVAWGLERLAAERTSGAGPDRPAPGRSPDTPRPRSALEDLESLVLAFADELALLGYRVINPPMGPSASTVTGWGLKFERAVVARLKAGTPRWTDRWTERAEGSFLQLEARAVLGLGPALAAGTEIRRGLLWGEDRFGGVPRAYVSGETMGVRAQAGRDSLWWGPGARGAFLLSDNTGPLEAVRLTANWGTLRLTRIVAPVDYQVGRVLYGMRYDWLPRDNLRLGFGETVVGTGGLYAPYVFNPIPVLNYAFSLWNRSRGQGLDDNYSFTVDFDWRVRPGVLAYGEVLFDDIVFGALGIGKPNPYPHRIGGLLGAQISNPFGLARSDLRFEHSRVSNWTYTTSRNLNDYVRDGRSLGHWCAPDCELWSVELTRRLAAETSASVAYELVRKGEGRLGQFWLDPDDARDKHYMWGVIETTHALRLGYSWMQRGGLSQAVSLTWSAISNAGHVSGQNRHDWYFWWEARHEF